MRDLCLHVSRAGLNCSCGALASTPDLHAVVFSRSATDSGGQVLGRPKPSVRPSLPALFPLRRPTSSSSSSDATPARSLDGRKRKSSSGELRPPTRWSEAPVRAILPSSSSSSAGAPVLRALEKQHSKKTARRARGSLDDLLLAACLDRIRPGAAQPPE